MLFLLRVAGQMVVGLRAPGWLPPMQQWNLMPYRLLVPIQLLFLAVMASIVVGLAREDGPLAERSVAFGRFLVGLSLAYAATMAVRYAVRMRRRPTERWFGGAIPIVFHVVLAAFLFTWGGTTSQADVIVVGAGASGLAVAATLKRRGREALVLERDDRVGGTWARRYDRLHLHTIRRFSGLPFHPMPPSYPKYVPKELYAMYLAEYAERLELDVRLVQPVARIGPLDAEWVVETPETEWRARAVVVATGRHNERRLPLWPGAEAFEGRLLHSEEYRSAREFAGKRVLVVGIGNTGAEIAADLVEEGAARVAIAVRTSPPITSREIAGIPVQIFGLLLFPFPPRAVDRVGAVLRRIGTGDLRKYGLGKPAWGPFTARRPPVIDVGFLKELKAGRVEVLPEVVSFTSATVEFRDGAAEEFDVVVAATGFGTALERLVDVPGALDERGYPSANGAHPGLFFAGYSETPRGQLLESNRRARRLAAAVSRHLEAAG